MTVRVSRSQLSRSTVLVGAMMSNFPRLALQLRVQMPIGEPVHVALLPRAEPLISVHRARQLRSALGRRVCTGASVHPARRQEVVHALLVPNELHGHVPYGVTVFFIHLLLLGAPASGFPEGKEVPSFSPQFSCFVVTRLALARPTELALRPPPQCRPPVTPLDGAGWCLSCTRSRETQPFRRRQPRGRPAWWESTPLAKGSTFA